MCGGKSSKFPAFIFLHDGFCRLCVFAFYREECRLLSKHSNIFGNGGKRWHSELFRQGWSLVSACVWWERELDAILGYPECSLWLKISLFCLSTTSIFYFWALKSSQGSFSHIAQEGSLMKCMLSLLFNIRKGLDRLSLHVTFKLESENRYLLCSEIQRWGLKMQGPPILPWVWRGATNHKRIFRLISHRRLLKKQDWRLFQHWS